MAVGNRLGRRNVLLAVSAGLLGFYGSTSLHAAVTNYYFDPGALKAVPGSGGTGNWDLTTLDWYVSGANDVAYASSTTTTAAVFGGLAGTVSLNSALSAFSANFNTGGYTVSGSSILTLGTGGITSNTSGGVTTFNNPITLGGAQVWTAGTAASPDTLSFNGNIVAGANGLTTGPNTGTVGFGYYNFSGASFTTSNKVTFDGTVNWSVANATIGGNPEGIGSGQSGTFSMTAGTTTITPGAGYYLFVGNGAVGTINVSGGTLNSVSANTTSSGILLGDGYNNTGASGGTGTLIVAGTGNFSTGTTTGTFSLGNLGSGVGEVDLNGGILSTLRTISKGASGTGGTGTAIVNFNGGTLQATGASLAVSGLTRANVRSGGAIINTNGFNVTIAQALLHTNLAADSSLTTDGGLTKNGNGILTLTGTNAWYGTTTVNGGTLKAGGVAAFPSSAVAAGSGALAVGAAGTLDFGGQYLAASGTTGGGLLVPTLALTSGGTLNFDINAASSDQLTIAGAATSTGGRITIGTTGTSITPGSFTVATAASGDLSGFTLATTRVNSGGFVYPISLVATTASDVVTVGAGQLAADYYTGSIDSNWNTLVGGMSNFATSAAGTTNAASIPGSISDVYLTATSANNLATILGQDFTINSLTFTGTGTSGTSPVSVGGSNTLTLLATSTLGAYPVGVGIVVNAGAAADLISANLALGSSQSITNNAANAFTISGNVSIGAYTLTTLGTGPKIISGTIAGTAGINASAGTLSLSGTNTYTGATVVTAGVLNASSFGIGGSPSALGASSNAASNLVLSGSTLQYNGSGGVVTDRLFTIGLTGGSNAATLDASDTGTGVNFNNSGQIAFTNSATHSLTFTGTSVNGNTFSPAITDQSTGNATSVNKTGVGTWQLNGTSSYTGATTITGGILVAASSSALGTGSINNINAGSAASSGTLGLAGGVTITNTITSFGARNDPATTTSAPQIENISGKNTVTSSLNLTGGGSGALIKSDAGTLTLSGNLVNTSGSAYSRPYFFYGAGNGVVSGTLSDAGNPASNGVAVTIEGPGTWTFTNNSNYSGGTTITGGTLQLGDGTSGHDGTISNTGSIIDNGTLAYNRFGSLTSSRNISGTGAVTMAGTGSQALTGSNSYTGGTAVNGGTLSFASAAAFPVDSSLNISGGAIATAANFGTGAKNNLITSNLSLAPTGKLDLNNNDLLVQNGSLMNISNAVTTAYAHGAWSGYGITSTTAATDPTLLHTLGVIQNSADGTTSGTVLYPNFDGITNGANTDVLVKYTYYGDANLDGKVDASDYSRIDAAYAANQTAPGSYTGWFNGDFNYDGVINGSDYTLIDNAFNTQGLTIASEIATPTAEIASSGSSAVPEPASLGVLGLGLAGLLGRRRRAK